MGLKAPCHAQGHYSTFYITGNAGTSPTTMTVSQISNGTGYGVSSNPASNTWSVESAAAAGQTEPSAYSSLFSSKDNYTPFGGNDDGGVVESSGIVCKQTTEQGHVCYNPEGHTGTYNISSFDGSAYKILFEGPSSDFFSETPFMQNFAIGPSDAGKDTFANGWTFYAQAPTSDSKGNYAGVTISSQDVGTLNAYNGDPLRIECVEPIPKTFTSCQSKPDGVMLATAEGGQLTLSNFIVKPLFDDYYSRATITLIKGWDKYVKTGYGTYDSFGVYLPTPPTVTYFGPAFSWDSFLTVNASNGSHGFKSQRLALDINITHSNTCTLDVPSSVDFGTITGNIKNSSEIAKKTIQVSVSCDAAQSDEFSKGEGNDFFRVVAYPPTGDVANLPTCVGGNVCIPFTNSSGTNNTGLVMTNTNGVSMFNSAQVRSEAGILDDITSPYGGTSTLDINVAVALLQDGEIITPGLHTGRAVIELDYN